MENCPICHTPPYIVDDTECKCGCGYIHIPKDEYDEILKQEAEISRGGHTYNDLKPIPQEIIDKVMNEPTQYSMDIVPSLIAVMTGKRYPILENMVLKSKYTSLNTLRDTTVLCSDVYDIVKTLSKTSELTSPIISTVMSSVMKLYLSLGVDIKAENYVCLPLKNGKHTSLFELISTLSQLRMSLNSHYGATSGMIIKTSDITRNKY